MWRRLIAYLVGEHVIAMIVEGPEAVKNVRRLCGPTEPASAPPGTIRGDWAEEYPSYKNVIHASDSQESADREMDLFFSPF